MPTKRLNGPSVRTGEGNLTEDLRDWMLKETGCFDLDWEKLTGIEIQVGAQTIFDSVPCGGVEGYRKAWEKYKGKIMSMLGKDPGFPAGTRPACWWRFESLEPRRQLSGPSPMPDDHKESRYQPHQGLFFLGIPTCWETMADADLAVFESELAYLERLGLLLPGEKEIIGCMPD